MSATVDNSYAQEMCAAQAMLPPNMNMQYSMAVPQDANMYANQCYGQQQYGEYQPYTYTMAPPCSPDDVRGGMAVGQDSVTGQSFMIDNGMNGSMPRSFILPKGAVGVQPDGAMQAFQNSMGGNYCFYDTTPYGGGSMMPQGFISGYEQLIGSEPKKAVKKQPAKKESTVSKRPKAKTLFPCC